MPVYSPLQKPENAEAIISILSDLGGLGFLGSDSIYFGYKYQEITEEIISRRKQYETTKKPEDFDEGGYVLMAESLDRTWKTDTFLGSPNTMPQFLTSPYPIEIEIYLDLNDGKIQSVSMVYVVYKIIV